MLVSRCWGILEDFGAEVGKFGIATFFAVLVMIMGQISAGHFKDFNHGAVSSLILAPLGGAILYFGMS